MAIFAFNLVLQNNTTLFIHEIRIIKFIKKRDSGNAARPDCPVSDQNGKI